jgi:TolB-like protein/DNA-binding winged helix-turn-helix (wHTH) protein/Flp pilus assembly protein TadD
MDRTSNSAAKFRFGSFQLDVQSGELRRDGIRIKLQEQPFQILVLLLGRPGEVVSREELRQKLWAADTFVDFDNGLNIAVNKLRSALVGDAGSSRYIETLPRRGYRFTAPVAAEQFQDPALTNVPSRSSVENAEVFANANSAIGGSARKKRKLAAAAVVVFAAGAVLLATNAGGLRDHFLDAHRDQRISSIAVLPLLNLSGDPAQEYFAGGMTEELITELAQIRSLRVISRTSALQYKDSHKTVPQIGRELNVDAIVEGAVVRSGNRVRITAQLIQTSNDKHLWAASYEEDIADILNVQREVAGAIAKAVNIILTPRERIQLAKAPTVSPEAYEAYLKGRHYANRLNQEGLRKGLEYFQLAVAADPKYARPYSRMANYYIAQTEWALPPSQAMSQAKWAAEKALQLDDTLANPHAILGTVHFWYDWNWTTAEREYLRAIELDPSDSGPRQGYSSALVWVGMTDKGIAEGKLALTLDPVSAEASRTLGEDYYYAHRYAAAIKQLREALQLEPGYWFTYVSLGRAYLEAGNTTEAISALRTATRMEPLVSDPLGELGRAYAVAGQPAKAREVIRQLQEESKYHYVAPYNLAIIYAGLGDKDSAFAWLEKAYDARSLFMTSLKTDPGLNGLRSDPRFASLTRRIGLPA